MEIPEKILCAANWYKDLPLKDDEWLRLRGISPYNVDKGIVFCGWRHGCCIAQMHGVTGLRQCEAGEEIQGFLTNKNRFVTREEGLIIALEQNQIIDMTDIRGNRLFSENLY